MAAWVNCPLTYTDGNLPIVSSIHHCLGCELVWLIQRGDGWSCVESLPAGEVVAGDLPWWLRLDHEHIRNDPHYKLWVSERLQKLLALRSL